MMVQQHQLMAVSGYTDCRLMVVQQCQVMAISGYADCRLMVVQWRQLPAWEASRVCSAKSAILVCSNA
eukprot:scaffold43914_cov17-Tisochrysis_lutea.AAC.2